MTLLLPRFSAGRRSLIVFVVLAASGSMAQKRVSCPDGDHPEIDVKQIAIQYSGTGFTATLESLSRLGAQVQLSANQLQEAADATQQWNQFIEGLVVGYNSCAITRQQYADGLNRIYPRLQADGASLEGISKLIAQGQAVDVKRIDDLVHSFYSNLRLFARASGKEEILTRIEDLSLKVANGNQQIVQREEDIQRQQQTVLARLSDIEEQLKKTPLASPSEVSKAVSDIRKALLSKADAAETAYNKGYALMESDHFKDAVPYLEEAAANVPLPQFYSALGRAYLMLHNIDSAVTAYREETRLKPDDGAAHDSLSLGLMLLGKYDEAIDEGHRAISLDPRDATYHNNLLLPLLFDKRYDEAVEEGRTAVQLNPQDATFHQSLAAAYWEQGKRNESAGELRTAIALDPSNFSSRVSMGFELMHEQKYDEAISLFRSVISQGDNDADAHSGLGWSLFNKDRREEAAEEFQRSISLDPRNASAVTGLGWVLYKSDRHPEAGEQFRKALALDPKSALAHHGLAAVLDGDGRYNEAIEEYKAALALDPTAGTHRDLGFALLRIKNWDEAVAEFRMALQVEPDNTIDDRGLAMALYELNQFKEASEVFQKVLPSSPNNLMVQLDAAISFAKIGDHARALDALRRAAILDPAEYTIQSLLCSQLFAARRYGDAVKECRKAATSAPDDPGPHWILGYALQEIGEHTESTRELEKARSIEGKSGPPDQ